MIQFLLSSLGMKLIGAAVIGAVLVTGFLWVKHTLNENAVLEQNNVLLEESVRQLNGLAEQRKEEMQQVRKSMEHLVLVNQRLQEQNRQLEILFNKLKPDGKRRDVGKLAIAKDRLIENIINKGTNKVMLCLEEITGNENPDFVCPDLP